jgi:hypothetical protein
MSRRLPLLPPAFLVVIAGIAAGAGPAAAAGCAPDGSRLQSIDNGVRVYETDGRGVIKTLVCSDSTGKRARLATEITTTRGPMGEYVGAIRYAGRYFAAEINIGDNQVGFYDAMIRRVDLSDGGQSRTDVCPACRIDRSNPTRADITDLALNRKGWMAWIASVRTNPLFYVVARRDSRGIALVDGGTDVEPRSLADSATTIFWNAHGGPQNQDLF